MSKDYSEDTLIEQPAIELLAGLGWQTIGAFDEVYGDGGTLGRVTWARSCWSGICDRR